MIKNTNETYGWTQDLKDIAQAEKSLEIIPYVSISFGLRKRDAYEEQMLHTFEMPRSMLDRWRWLIRWREARLQCEFPRDNVRCSYCFYDKKSGLSLDWNSLLSRLAATKAQVTKVERVISEYIDFQKVNNLFFDEQTDEVLRKAYRKLEQKRCNLRNLQREVQQEVESVRKISGSASAS